MVSIDVVFVEEELPRHVVLLPLTDCTLNTRSSVD